jgi:hypothetical protein
MCTKGFNNSALAVELLIPTFSIYIEGTDIFLRTEIELYNYPQKRLSAIHSLSSGVEFPEAKIVGLLKSMFLLRLVSDYMINTNNCLMSYNYIMNKIIHGLLWKEVEKAIQQPLAIGIVFLRQPLYNREPIVEHSKGWLVRTIGQ